MNNNGRKIPSNFENPIDNILIKLCDININTFQKCNITPNMVTIFRFFLSIGVFYKLFYTCEIAFPIIGSAICYFLDCMDGHLARSTNQITILGDYLDHAADLFFVIMFSIYMITKQYDYKEEIIIFMAILGYMSCVHLSLQQKNYAKLNSIENRDELLDSLDMIHNYEARDIIWSRYFGFGTLIFCMLFVIYFIQTQCH